MGRKKYPKPPQHELDAWVKKIEEEKGHEICGGWLWRQGRPCKRGPNFLMAGGRCKDHGGKSPSGPASGTFKHGRYSKYFPHSMAKKIEAFLGDGDLVDLRRHIALVDLRIKDVLDDIEEHGSSLVSMWDRLEKRVGKLNNALNRGDIEVAAGHMRALLQDFERGSTARDSWDQALDLVDRRARLVKEQHKIETDAERTFTTDEVVMILASVADIISKRVSNRRTVDLISRDLDRLYSQPTPEA